MTMRLLLAVVAIAGCIVGGRFALHGSLGATHPPQLFAATQSLSVPTVVVTMQDEYIVKRYYTGTVHARRSSDVGFEHGGRVIAVHVNEGERVGVDQPLATLDTRRLEAERKELAAQRSQAVAVLDELLAGPRPEAIKQSRSRVKDLEEQLELSRSKRIRAEQLVAQRVSSEESLEDAISSEEQLTARLQVAREERDELLAGSREERVRAAEGVVEQLDAALELADLNIENGVVRSPFSGIVSKRFIDEGRVVQSGETILRIIEDAHPEAWIGLPVDMADSITTGGSYELEVGGRTVRAKASALLPEMDANTRAITAILSIDADAPSTYPGQVVRLSLEKSISDRGIWIPTTALTRGVHGLWNCFAITIDENDDSSTLEYRQVEVLYAEGDRLYVRGTLRDGDRIVTEGTHRLVAGQRVQPIETQT